VKNPIAKVKTFKEKEKCLVSKIAFTWHGFCLLFVSFSYVYFLFFSFFI